MGCSFAEFSSVARRVLLRHVSDSEKILGGIPDVPCEDQYVGCVSKILSESPDADFPVRMKLENGEISPEKFPHGVVIVLESPNKAEFLKVGNKYESRGPARYCTGCRFREYWSCISAEKFGAAWNDYAIFLINAVQYQCSLASAGRLVPDGVKGEVFCQCMEQKAFQDSLRLRIEGVKELCDEMILVNACTRDCKGDGYKAVSKILLSNKEGLRVFGTTHPSGWQCPRNRVMQELNCYEELPSISPYRCE